jgi:DNA-binding winged helix-turn-helix (wHTH) protein/tetratricopeptide (TPR) repeat protein
MDQDPDQRTVFKAGDLELEPHTRRLRIGGRIVYAPRLSYRLLEVLIKEAPRVVSADELIEKVWQNRIVSPETITQRVKLARQAIGDDAKEPKYIAVVWGQGYRFLADVERIPPAEGARTRRTAALLLLLVAGATAAVFYRMYPGVREQPVGSPYTQPQYRPDAVAVLPFRLVGDAPRDLYMSEGIAYVLRAQLGRVDGLKMAAETSSLAFRNQNILAQEISSRLGVGRLIEGTVAPEQDSLRVLVRIIDGATGLQTWSKPYEGAVQQLVDIQQQIALDVARQLMDDPGLVIGNPVTQNTVALDFMYRARHLEQQIRDEQIVDPQKQRQVIELYRQATEADPNSAAAYSRLASALLYTGDVSSARAPIIRAMALDPSISDIQYTLGHYYWRTNDERAGEAYREAIRLNPENAGALGAYGHWSLQQADADEAGEYFRRALNVDPQSLERYRDLGAYFGATGKREQALSLAQEIQLRFDDVRSYQVLARMYEQTGDVDVAIAWARKAVRREPGNPEFKWQLAELYSRIGEPDMANFFQPEPGLAKLYWQRRYDELIDAAEEAMIDYPSELPIRYMLAFAYNVKGRYEDAISLLERSGLPERARSTSRFVAAVEALMSLAIAYQAVGQTDEANEALQFIFDYVGRTIDSGADKTYWPYLYGACALSIAGRNQEALAHLEHIVESSELAWEPVLRDSPCFAPFADEPAYLAVLAHFEQRKQALREKVPETLDQFSGSL